MDKEMLQRLWLIWPDVSAVPPEVMSCCPRDGDFGLIVQLTVVVMFFQCGVLLWMMLIQLNLRDCSLNCQRNATAWGGSGGKVHSNQPPPDNASSILIDVKFANGDECHSAKSH